MMQGKGGYLDNANVATNSTWNKISQLRDKPWEVRYTSGVTATRYQYTGQYSNMSDFSLMFYNARWYDPALGASLPVGATASITTAVPKGSGQYKGFNFFICRAVVGDNYMKLLWLPLLWIFVLSSCVSPSENHIPVESNFPLKQNQIFSTDDVIRRIAVSDTWMVIDTLATTRIIDLDTKKLLWETNLTIQADDPLGFVIVDDVLVATSANQVVLMDKLGNKKMLTLEAPDEDTGDNITRVAAVYSDNIYINRSPDWELEAYSLSQNARLWTLDVGRGSTDVFYDDSTGLAYVTTRYESFFAIDNTTGEVLWKYGGRTLRTTYEDGVIYAVGMGSNSHSIRLSAFDVAKQVELWASEVTFSKYVYTMTVINDLVVLSGDEGLLAVNKADGSMLWQTPKGESFMTKAVEYDGMIYAKGTSYTVYAISPQTGDFVGYLSLESNKPFEPEDDRVSGVYRVKDGIVFNTRHAVWMYKK